MHDEAKPHFVLADIKQAVLSGNYVLMPYAVSGLGDTGLSTADVEQVLAGLEPEFFHRVLALYSGGMGRTAVRLVYLPAPATRPDEQANGLVAQAGVGSFWPGPDLQPPLVPGAEMKCGRCEGEYREVIEPQTFKVRGRRVTVPVALLKCEVCGDAIYSPEQADSAQQAVYAEIRRRENLLPPAEITALRQELGLKQDEFERLLGVGPKTVVRWESGRVFQSKAADSLMRLVRADRENAVRLGEWNDVPMRRAPSLGRRVRKAS